MAQVGDLTVVLKADASDLTAGVQRSASAVSAFAETGTRNMRVLSAGFTALAIQATNIPGPIAKITEGLLLMSGGHVALLEMAAVLGTIGGGMTLLGADTRALTDDVRKFGEELQHALGEASPAAKATETLKSIGERMDKLQEQAIDPTFFIKAKEWLAGMLVPGGDQDMAAVRIRLITTALKELELQWNVTMGKFKGEHGNDVAKAGDEAYAAWDRLYGVLARVKDLTDQFDASVLSTIRVGLPLDTLTHGKGPFPGGSKFDVRNAPGADLINQLGLSLDQIGNAGAQITNTLADPLQDKLLKRMGQIGQAGARALVEGMIEGTLSLSQFLERSMIDILTTALTGGLGKLLGPLFGSAMGGPGGAGSPGIYGMRTAGPSLNINLGGMPPAMNPLAAARDQQWQAFFRETALQAKSDGFHG
jgi:hypothetical protein